MVLSSQKTYQKNIYGINYINLNKICIGFNLQEYAFDFDRLNYALLCFTFTPHRLCDYRGFKICLIVKYSIHCCQFSLIFFLIWVFLLRTPMIHKTAGEGRGPFLFPTIISIHSRKLRHFCTAMHLKCLPRVLNCSACNYQAVTRRYLSTSGN